MGLRLAHEGAIRLPNVSSHNLTYLPLGTSKQQHFICDGFRRYVARNFFLTLGTHFAIDSEDNVYWGGDQNIPYPRPSFQINDTL